MLLKNTEDFIDENDPWKDDQLERKKIADKLTSFVETVSQPFVIAIDSEYGGGKSFFIKRWKQDLDNKRPKFTTAYFNAWETDFAEDPLAAFLSELNDSLFIENDNHKATEVKKAREAVKTLLKRMAFNILERATVGAFKADDLTAAEESMDTLLDKKLRNFKEAKDAMRDFRTILSEFATECSPDTDQQKPVVIFIDELDRCRPTYAIELLEIIKHIFNVPNFVFVLGIDRKQLKSSIASVYGINMNGEGYIKKFIDWTYSLPSPNHENYTKYLCEKFSLDTVVQNKDGMEALIHAFQILSKFFTVTLREQEQLFTQLNVILRVNYNTNEGPNIWILCVLLFLKEKSPDIYRKCPSFGNETPIIDHIKAVSGDEAFFLHHKGQMLYHALVYGMATNVVSIEERMKEIQQKQLPDTTKTALERIFHQALRTKTYSYGNNRKELAYCHSCIEDEITRTMY